MSCHPPSAKFLERKIKYSNRAASSASNMSSFLWKKKKRNLVTLLVENSVFGQFSSRALWFLNLHLVVFPSIFPAWCIYRSDESHFDHFVSRVENSSSIIFPILVSFSTFFLLFNVNLILFLIFDISIIYKLKIRNKEKLFDRLSYILEFNLTLIHHLTEASMPLYPSKESTLDPFSIL